MPENNYRKFLLEKIRFFSNIILGIISFFTISIMLGIGILFYFGYIEYGDHYSIYIVVFGLLFIFVTGIAVKHFFKHYVQIMHLMSNSDLETLERISESRWWIEKYLPSFIIHSGNHLIIK